MYSPFWLVLIPNELSVHWQLLDFSLDMDDFFILPIFFHTAFCTPWNCTFVWVGIHSAVVFQSPVISFYFRYSEYIYQVFVELYETCFLHIRGA